MAAEQAPPTNTNLTAGAAPAGGQAEFPSAFSLFKPSWEGLKQNIVELVVLFVIPTLVYLVLFFIAGLSRNGHTNSEHPVALIGLGLLSLIYTVLLGPAIVHIQLKSSLNQKATYESAWATSKKYWWRFLILSIMVGATIIVGVILLIIPGIIFLKRYLFSIYVLIDQDLGLVESMKKSNELSKGRSMTVYGVLGVDILINIPGVIPVIGQIISFVLQIAYFCGPAIRYQQLKAKPASVSVAPAPVAAPAVEA
jgi:uncharacterized membrane protein